MSTATADTPSPFFCLHLTPGRNDFRRPSPPAQALRAALIPVGNRGGQRSERLVARPADKPMITTTAVYSQERLYFHGRLHFERKSAGVAGILQVRGAGTAMSRMGAEVQPSDIKSEPRALGRSKRAMVPSSFKSSALGAFAFFAQLLMAAPANADFDRLAPRRLRLSAVVSSAPPDDTAARIECWEFATPFRSYPTVGEAIALANTTNATYVVLPARSKEGLHHPPHPM